MSSNEFNCKMSARRWVSKALPRETSAGKGFCPAARQPTSLSKTLPKGLKGKQCCGKKREQRKVDSPNEKGVMHDSGKESDKPGNHWSKGMNLKFELILLAI